MTTAASVAVVGASLAGLRAAEQLRAAGHQGPITVLGAEPHLPYNRPPLSKEVLSSPDAGDPGALAEQLMFRRRASTVDVQFRLGDAVVAVEMARGSLTTAGGSRVGFDALVVATGLRPRRLAVEGPNLGRHVLRTVEDCYYLRAELHGHGPRRAVVVGAGFIGCEVAASLRKLGHEVTVVEPAGAPMERVVGPALASAVQRHHEDAGIRFRLGTGITGYIGADRVSGVVLSSGEIVPTDVVVEAVGSACNSEWLEGNDLDLSDGVLTDNDLAVAGVDRVVAVGDVARFPNPLFDNVPRRVEHWSIPTDTAKRAAVTLVNQLNGAAEDQQPFAPVPSFWSDQFDLRLQSFGSPGLADEAVVDEGDLGELAAGVLMTYRRAGRHVGSLAINLSGARQRELRTQFADLAHA